ncbi:hypothetical protein WJX84_011349 [Apatococcus fuscideae]|uniref:F-box domain-containing protein n=1 Tax=Apatococcus fuscideae TaxID=2026836 RepID=A0AAW1SNK5_9CHLO
MVDSELRQPLCAVVFPKLSARRLVALRATCRAMASMVDSLEADWQMAGSSGNCTHHGLMERTLSRQEHNPPMHRLREPQQSRPPGILRSPSTDVREKPEFLQGFMPPDAFWAESESDTQEPSHVFVYWPFGGRGFADALRRHRYLLPVRQEDWFMAVVKDGNKLLLLQHSGDMSSSLALPLQVDLISGRATELPAYALGMCARLI